MNDFDFDVVKKVKQGRRSNKETPSLFSADSTAVDSMSEFSAQNPVRIKKAGGWADDTFKPGKNKSSTNLIEQQRFQEYKTDLDDTIPIIPDIEEIQDDILDTEIAQAPSVAIESVTTYKQLDKELLSHNGIQQFGDISLSYLTRFMYPVKDHKETDEMWTKESLFNELITTCRRYE